MTTNAILTTEGLKTMSAHQPKPASAPEASDDPRWDAVMARDADHDGTFRVWRVEHGRLLPAIVRGAAATPGERAVFPEARRRRAVQDIGPACAAVPKFSAAMPRRMG